MRALSLFSLKNVSLLTIFSAPFLSLSFYSKPKSTNQFSLAQSRGLSTRVRLFIEGLPESPNLQTTNILGGGTQALSNSQKIIQVGTQKVSSSAEKNKTPALIAELSLKNLDRADWWKFCIPEGSILKKLSKNSTTSSSTSSAGSQNLCKPEWFGYSKEKTSENAEIITYLLKMLSQFIQVEHVVNMFAIYDEKTYYPEGSTRRNSQNSIFKNMKDECNLSGENTKSLLNDLFFTTSSKKKKCLLSPVTMKVNLDLKNRINQSESSTNVTKNILSKGIVSGNLNYGLFDYWARLKNIKKDNSANKVPIFKFNNERKYSLSGGTCQLSSLYKLVDSRQFTSESFFEKCPHLARASK